MNLARSQMKAKGFNESSLDEFIRLRDRGVRD